MKSTKRFKAASLMVVAAMAAAGCADSGDTTAGTAAETETDLQTTDPDTETNGETATSETKPESAETTGSGPTELTTVSVGVTSLHTWYWPVIVAKHEGTMEPCGVAIDVVTFGAPAQVNSALVGGSIHFSMSAPDGIFPVQEERPSIQMVGSVVNTNPYSMVAAEGVESPADLEGATLGAASAGAGADYATIRVMMAANGLALDEDYTIVGAGSTGERVAALEQGVIDATVQFPPSLAVLTDAGYEVIDSASNYPELQQAQLLTMVADSDWYSENMETAQGFAECYSDSVEWLYAPENRDRAIELLMTEMDVEEPVAEGAYVRFVEELEAYPTDPTLDPARLEQAVTNYEAVGIEVPEGDLGERYDNALFEAAG